METYGFGNDTPAALNHFLRLATRYSSPEFVLLVGGHTYDYLDIKQQGVVNFIPAHYRPVGLFGFAPTDNPFADFAVSLY